MNRVTPGLRPPKPRPRPFPSEAEARAAWDEFNRPYREALTARVDAMLDRLLGKDNPTP